MAGTTPDLLTDCLPSRTASLLVGWHQIILPGNRAVIHFTSRLPSLRRFAAMKLRDHQPNEVEASLSIDETG